MIKIKQKGNFSKTDKFFEKMRNLGRNEGAKALVNMSIFDEIGREGVRALQAATPKSTGKTASSWYYEIYRGEHSTKVVFCNSNIQNDIPVAILLQYGHADRQGHWVQGIDYINPALEPIFKELADKLWAEVKRA